jgi:hypothetical protein
MRTFIDRHADKIRRVFSCFDRVVLTGTLPDLCHVGAVTKYLGARKIRLFDYPRKENETLEDVFVRVVRG